MALRNAYWSLHRQTDAHLEPLNVTAHQYVLLEILSQNGPSKQSELVQYASSDPNTIRAMVLTMCKLDLVERVKHPTDGRAWLVQLTPKAEALMPQLRERGKLVRNRFSTGLDEASLQQFLSYLQRFAATVAAD